VSEGSSEAEGQSANNGGRLEREGRYKKDGEADMLSAVVVVSAFKTSHAAYR